jgi:histidinol-phosphate aminotransferase
VRGRPMIRPRQAVRDVTVYSVPPEGRRGAVRLDFNENTAGFPDVVALGDLPAEVLTSYPEYGALQGALGATVGLPPDHLLLCNGSDDSLSVLAATYVEPAGPGAALVSRPTYALIPYFLQLYGARLVEVPARADLSFDLDGIAAALDRERGRGPVQLAVFASPDNPSGAVLDPGFVLAQCARHPDTLFVLDEAYAEYGAAPTLLEEVQRQENLLVLRTFSKAWGLAGLRLGYIAGCPELLGWLRRVRLPFTVNALAVEAALRLLPEAERVQKDAAAAMARKAQLVAALRGRGFTVHDGAANFFLLLVGPSAPRLCAHCRGRGVLLRDRSQLPETAGMIRITVGTAEENATLLRAVDDFASAADPGDPRSDAP